MRFWVALFACALLWTGPAHTAPPKGSPFATLQTTVDWLNNYRVTRDLKHAPMAVRALSLNGGFKEPEAAGVYVGFIAGVLGSNPERADTLLSQMLPVRDEDQWAVVRGIAYSRLPNWKDLLRRHAPKLATRQTMIDKYLEGSLPTLDALAITPSPTTWQRIEKAFAIDWPGSKKKSKQPTLEPTQVLLDTLWGYYLASGSYGPVLRIIELLPWSKDKDNVDRLTVGNMAKYTLAMNATRDGALLEKLKTLRNARNQKKETVKLLDEVIAAAETADAAKLRQEALASI